jgi:hypothetical protein
MEDERKAEEEVLFVNMMRTETVDSEEEMVDELERTQVAVDDCYCRRAGLDIGSVKGRPLSEKEKDDLSERLGDGEGAQAKRRKRIVWMSIRELEAEIEETEKACVRNGIRRAGCLPLTLAILCLTEGLAKGFIAYDCSNRSNITELYSLLEPDACANMGKEGEVETTMYREIVQIKQDRMIPVFRCVVIETIVSQYCRHFSSAVVTRYIGFREPKTLEAWECCQARKNGKVVINGRSFQAKIGSTASHAMFLSGALDDDSNCETGIISFPNGKTLGGGGANCSGALRNHTQG